MNPAQLLAHFDRLAESPDAIPRLRRFLLDLAVRGKLVEQEPGDEPASELLKRIQTEKARLVSGGEIKKEKSLPAIEGDEIPFELPIGWEWERLGNIGDTNIGLTYSPQDISDVGIPVLRSSNIQKGKLDFSDLVRVRCEPKQSVMVRDGDLLICARNGSRGLVGKVAVIEDLKEPAAFGAFMAVLRSGVNQYLYQFICSPLFRQVIDEVNTTTINQITQNNLRSTLAPIPPLAEQQRIVAKVDELMALCDRLEAARTERESRRDRLVTSSLNRLNNGADPDAFRDHARFYFNHLPRLTTKPEQIQQLRQTILNLAVRGKLVPQNPHDEPVSELLKRIETEKAKLGKERKRKQAVELDPVDDTQSPFNLPPSWVWARFPELGVFGRGKSKHRPRNDRTLFVGGTHLLIQTGDVARSKGVIETHTSKYNDIGLAQSMKWPKGTLCITIAANIADSGILSFDACFPDSVVGFIPSSEFPSAKYFEYFIRTAKADLLAFAPATAQKNINLEILSAVLIPLPPLAEQQRIVAKVDELMALCDKLDAQFITTHADSRRLLEAILHQALCFRLGSEQVAEL